MVSLVRPIIMSAINKDTTSLVPEPTYSLTTKRRTTEPITIIIPPKAIAINTPANPVPVLRTIPEMPITMVAAERFIPAPKADNIISTVMATKPMFRKGMEIHFSF